MDSKPVVGMTVYLRPTIYNPLKTPPEGTLTKIGRKYYTVAALHWEYKFELDSLKMISDYSPDYTLYFSLQQMYQDIEHEELIKKLTRFFYDYPVAKSPLSLDKLREIARLAGIIPESTALPDMGIASAGPAGV